MEIETITSITIIALLVMILIILKRVENYPYEVGYFEKISYKQFKEDYNTYKCESQVASLAVFDTPKIYDGVKLPKRATKGSAGYDFYSPVAFVLKPNEAISFPTGVRTKINNGWALKIYPRSSMGFKYQTVLANTVGIIDSDYYHGYNEGHIWIKLVNNGDKELVVKRGDRVAQGIFEPYGTTYNDKTKAKRTGGFGSSGR